MIKRMKNTDLKCLEVDLIGVPSCKCMNCMEEKEIEL